MTDFAGKVALVTGGGSGIGRESCLRFARGGARIVVCDISEAGGNETVDLLKAVGSDAVFVKCDVSDPAQVEAAVARAVEAFGGLHIVVNNAGIGGSAAPTGEIDIADWNKVIGISLNGVMHGMRFGIPAILTSGGGAIVNISSILGLVGFSGSPAYVASKHAVSGLTKAAAIEYAEKGIRINSIHPGFVDTPLVAGVMPQGSDIAAFIASKHAMNRFGTPDEIANAIIWLASDEASFVTGAQFAVDGGYTCQ